MDLTPTLGIRDCSVETHSRSSAAADWPMVPTHSRTRHNCRLAFRMLNKPYISRSCRAMSGAPLGDAARHQRAYSAQISFGPSVMGILGG